MPVEPLNCPYCGSLVADDATSSPPRIRCSRCQEVVVNKRSALPAKDATIIQPATTKSPVVPRRGNRSFAGILVGAMAGMAGIGLAFALYSQQQRRDRDRPVQAPEAVREIGQVQPANLAGLGYLPPGTNVIVAAHVAELLRNPAGAELLGSLQFGTSSFSLKGLIQATTIDIDDLDHAILGLRVDERFPPRVCLVLSTRRVIDQQKLRDQLKTTGKSELGGKTAYRFRLAKPPMEPYVCFLGERTLAFGLTPSDITDVPAKPALSLPPALQDMLTERMLAPCPLWIAGTSPDWTKSMANFLFEQMPKEPRERLSEVRTFGIWFRPETKVIANVAFECANEGEAKAFEAYLKRVAPPKKESSLSPALEKLWVEAGQSFIMAQKGTWVDLQAAVTVESLAGIGR